MLVDTVAAKAISALKAAFGFGASALHYKPKPGTHYTHDRSSIFPSHLYASSRILRIQLIGSLCPSSSRPPRLIVPYCWPSIVGIYNGRPTGLRRIVMSFSSAVDKPHDNLASPPCVRPTRPALATVHRSYQNPAPIRSLVDARRPA